MFSPAFHLALGSASAAPPADLVIAHAARARDGDAAAQAILVGHYHARISGFVRSIIVDRAAVDDVTQIVFIKMTQQIATLRDAAVFEAWLFALARHAAYDFLRRRRRLPLIIALDAEPIDLPAPSDARDVDEIAELLRCALARLRPIDRQIVDLVIEGNSYCAIAARTGLTASGVRVRLARLRRYLRATVGGALGTHAADAKMARAPRGWAAAA